MSDYKKLRRSTRNNMIAGVMGGLGEHYGIDPVKLRIIYVLLSVFSGAFPGIIIYIILWILIPKEEEIR